MRSRVAMATAMACAERASGCPSPLNTPVPVELDPHERDVKPSSTRCRTACSAGSSGMNCGTTMSGEAPRARARREVSRSTSRVTATPRSMVSLSAVAHEKPQDFEETPAFSGRQPHEALSRVAHRRPCFG